MADTNTTRRGLLRLGTGALAYGAGAAAVTAAGFAVTKAHGAELPKVSPELVRLIEQHRDADAAIDRWYRETWNPAIEAHERAIAGVPHVTADVPAYRNVIEGHVPARTYSTASKSDVRHCRAIGSIDRDLGQMEPEWPSIRRAARRVLAGQRWREQQLARLKRQWSAAGLHHRENDLLQPISAARGAIHSFPVASIADLAAKLAWMGENEANALDGEDLLPLIATDVARLTGEAQA